MAHLPPILPIGLTANREHLAINKVFFTFELASTLPLTNGHGRLRLLQGVRPVRRLRRLAGSKNPRAG